MNKEFQNLEEKAKKIESECGNLESFVKETTNFAQKHRMEIGEETFSSLKKIYDDLQDLAKADLIDFQKYEGYGKFD